MQDIYIELNNLLKDKFPSQEERDKIIEEMGKTVIAETVADALESVKDEEKRSELLKAFNAGDPEKVSALLDGTGFDFYENMANKSKQILAEVLA